MRSPFPGMDPFVETANWPGFQTLLIGEIVAQLVPLVRPRYAVLAEQRLYVESVQEERREIRPDVAVAKTPYTADSPAGGVAIETVTATTYSVTIPQEQEEPFIEIRGLAGHELVTVIEVLSPSNKRDGSEGRQEYLRKRNEVLRSQVNLVEIDLLRGGLRSPTDEPLRSSTDYCALVHRAPHRPLAEAYEWTIRDRVPTIPIPLAAGEPEVSLDLQEALDRVYERAGYDYLIDYDSRLRPPLRAVDVAWVRSILASRA